MIGLWEEEEVKTLFQLVEDCKKNNISIKEAFLKHSQLYARKPNSVRNYYYHEVDNLNKDCTSVSDRPLLGFLKTITLVDSFAFPFCLDR